MKIIFILIASLLLVSCEIDHRSNEQISQAKKVEIEQAQPETQAHADRFEVRRVQVVRDDLAYGNSRGIYIIKDKQTGVEYIGMSGIGISEIGSHQSGKARVSDEKY